MTLLNPLFPGGKWPLRVKALGVAKILELSCSAVEDVDTSTLLAGFMMTESQECSQNHLKVQFQWDKSSAFDTLQWIDVGCCHVDECCEEVDNPRVLQSKCHRVPLGMGMRCTTHIHKCSQQLITISFLFLHWSQSDGSGCRCHCCAHRIELNCDKC